MELNRKCLGLLIKGGFQILAGHSFSNKADFLQLFQVRSVCDFNELYVILPIRSIQSVVRVPIRHGKGDYLASILELNEVEFLALHVTRVIHYLGHPVLN